MAMLMEGPFKFSWKGELVHVEDATGQAICGSPNDFVTGISDAVAWRATLLKDINKRQSVAACRSELSVVPLCRLCTRHDLPRD